jgi:hypothetical protein
VEQLPILAPQNAKGITNIPVQLQPEPAVFTTAIPLPLWVNAVTVRQATLLVVVPVPFQLTMTEVLTSVRRKEICTGVMV